MADLRLRAEVDVQGQAAAVELDRLKGKVAEAGAATRGQAPAAQAAAAATAELGRAAQAAGSAQAGLGLSASEAARVLREQGRAARDAANAQQAASATARQSRAAYQQLGFQVQDVAAQAAAGTSAFVILAQQGGQVAASMIGLGGVLGRVGAFIAGPFGAALLGVVTVLGLTAARASEAAQAKERLGGASRELGEAQRALQAVLGRVNVSMEEQGRLALYAAQATLRDAAAAREAADAKLRLASASAAAARANLMASGGAGEAAAGAGLASFLAERRASAAFRERLAAGNDELFAQLRQQAAQRQIEIERARLAAAAATDQAAAATQRYQRAEESLQASYRAGRISYDQLVAGLTSIARARDAEQEAARAATRQAGQSGQARRAEADGMREAAAAAREMQSAYVGIVQAYLPLKAAEEARLRRLADITRLERAGRLSAAEAATARAGVEYERGTPSIDRAQFDAVQQLRRETQGWLDQLDRDLAQVPGRFEIGMKEAGRSAFEDVAREGLQAIDLIAGAIGGKFGRALRGVSGLLSMAGQLGARGAGAGQAGGAVPLLAGGSGGLLGGFRTGLREAFRPVESLLNKAFGGGAGSFATVAGKAFAGASVGSIVTGIGSALGLKTSAVGGQIGGAIGSFLPIPGGSIIGSVLGGLLGGLFQTVKKGSATLSTAGGGFGQGAVTGNSRSFQAVASGLLSGVTQTLDELVARLGGQVGTASVSVGKRGDTFRVDTSGQGRTKVRGSGGLVKEFTTEAEAIAFATLDAIRDGAITGLSEAVSRALRSSDNLERAVREALKVQELEDLLAGAGAAARKAFADFERQARERLRIATRYGFDLVELERITQRQRAELLESATASAVGGLKRLLDELRLGSRFEGSILDQRAALQAEIATVSARARAGEEGAAERLADLLARLDEVSREAFGTAGTFAADRAAIIQTAEAVVAETERRLRAQQEAAIAAARGDQTAARLDGTNRLLDENNAQNAQMLAALNAVEARLAAIEAGGVAFAGGGGVVADWSVRLAQRL